MVFSFQPNKLHIKKQDKMPKCNTIMPTLHMQYTKNEEIRNGKLHFLCSAITSNTC